MWRRRRQGESRKIKKTEGSCWQVAISSGERARNVEENPGELEYTGETLHSR